MSGKRNIAMSPNEIHEFLLTRRTVVVVAASSGQDPIATVAPATYVEGVMEVALPVHDPVARAIADDARVCCIAEQAPSYFEIKAVMVRGTAESHGEAADGIARYRVPVGTPTSFDFGRLETQ